MYKYLIKNYKKYLKNNFDIKNALIFVIFFHNLTLKVYFEKSLAK